MGSDKLAQLERISQQINFQIQNVNHLMAQAGFEMELTHHLMKIIGETFNEFVEEEINHCLFR